MTTLERPVRFLRSGAWWIAYAVDEVTVHVVRAGREGLTRRSPTEFRGFARDEVMDRIIGYRA